MDSNRVSDDRDIRSAGVWFIALGGCFLGFSAIVFFHLDPHTSASSSLAGTMMVAAAALQIAQSFRVHDWVGFPGWLSSAVFYGVAGSCVILGANSAMHTIFVAIGFALLSSAIARIWSSLQFRSENRGGWMFASGAATVAAALVLMFVWPLEPACLLALGMGVDIAAQGTTAVILGWTLKSDRTRQINATSQVST